MQSTRPASIKFLRISPLAGLVGRHGAVGKNEARRTAWREVVEEVLHPREVGVTHGRHAVLPPAVVTQPVAAPVETLNGGLARMYRPAGRGVGRCGSCRRARSGPRCHGSQGSSSPCARSCSSTPGRRWRYPPLPLPPFPLPLAWARMNSTDCTNIPTSRSRGRRPGPGKVPASRRGGARRCAGVELSALATLGQGELLQEVFVDAGREHRGAGVGPAEPNVAHEVDDLPQAGLIQRRARVVLGQDVLRAELSRSMALMASSTARL